MLGVLRKIRAEQPQIFADRTGVQPQYGAPVPVYGQPPPAGAGHPPPGVGYSSAQPLPGGAGYPGARMSGTVKAAPKFDPEIDCEALRKAMRDQDLITDLEGEMVGEFENIFKAMMIPPAKYDASELHRAIAGTGIAEGVLIEILYTRSNEEIRAITTVYKTLVTRSEVDMVQIKQEFERMYGKTLASFFEGDCPRDYKRVLLSLIGAEL